MISRNKFYYLIIVIQIIVVVVFGYPEACRSQPTDLSRPDTIPEEQEEEKPPPTDLDQTEEALEEESIRPPPIDFNETEETLKEDEAGTPPPTDLSRPGTIPEEQEEEKPPPTDLDQTEEALEEEPIRPPPTDFNEIEEAPEKDEASRPPPIDFDQTEEAREEDEEAKRPPSADFSEQESVPEEQKGERLLSTDQAGSPDIQKQKYTGTPITLDFRNTNIQSVLKFMAEINNYNIIIDPDVKGNITISLHKAVPWDQAMDIIMRTSRLSMKIEGNIIRVGKMENFDQEMEIIPIHYAQANRKLKDKLMFLLTKAKGIREPPSIIIDERTNSIIVKDVPEKISKIKEVLAELDREMPQVMIQIRIVETTKEYSQDLGIRWGGRYNRTINYRFPRTISATGIRGTPYAVNLPNQSDIFGGIELRLGHINGLSQLNIALEAMESEGKGKIISNPRIATMDNEIATILSGSKVPYPTTDKDGNPKVQFVDASIKLVVRPHITPDNTIIMQIVADKSEPDWAHLVNGRPTIITRKATTRLIVNDEDTAVIGGLYQRFEQDSKRRVPFFSKIPLIGLLFKAKKSDQSNDELLIFITPTIMSQSFSSNEQILRKEEKKIQVKRKIKSDLNRMVKEYSRF